MAAAGLAFVLIGSRDASADLILPAFPLDALLGATATANDTILTPAAVAYFGAHWVLYAEQLDWDLDRLHNEILVLAQHISMPPPHGGRRPRTETSWGR